MIQASSLLSELAHALRRSMVEEENKDENEGDEISEKQSETSHVKNVNEEIEMNPRKRGNLINYDLMIMTLKSNDIHFLQNQSFFISKNVNIT